MRLYGEVRSSSTALPARIRRIQQSGYSGYPKASWSAALPPFPNQALPSSFGPSKPELLGIPWVSMQLPEVFPRSGKGHSVAGSRCSGPPREPLDPEPQSPPDELQFAALRWLLADGRPGRSGMCPDSNRPPPVGDAIRWHCESMELLNWSWAASDAPRP